MSGVSVKVHLDQGKINALLFKTTDKAALKAAQKTRDRMRASISRQGRVRTGALLKSVNVRKIGSPAGVTSYSVGSSLPYASYQDQGIGPVTARAGGVLRFKPKGTNAVIFRPRTRGFAGAHFVREARNALTLADFL